MAASDCVRVAVIDEHEVVRAGVHSLLVGLDVPLKVSGSFARPAEYLAWLHSDREADVLVTEIQENGHAPDLANAGRPAPTKSALLARAIEDGILGLSDLSAVRTG